MNVLLYTHRTDRIPKVKADVKPVAGGTVKDQTSTKLQFIASFRFRSRS
jgi:hypothetical protein